MKIGDLVKFKIGGNGRDMLGFIMRVDKDYHGAGQAFKVYNASRGHCLHPKMVNGIGPTLNGIEDRILVLWNDETGWEYCKSGELEIVSSQEIE